MKHSDFLVVGSGSKPLHLFTKSCPNHTGLTQQITQKRQGVGRPAHGKRQRKLGFLPLHLSSKIGLQKEQTLLVAPLGNKTWKDASSRGFPGQGKKINARKKKKRNCLSLIAARRNLQASHFLACGSLL